MCFPPTSRPSRKSNQFKAVVPVEPNGVERQETSELAGWSAGRAGDIGIGTGTVTDTDADADVGMGRVARRVVLGRVGLALALGNNASLARSHPLTHKLGHKPSDSLHRPTNLTWSVMWCWVLCCDVMRPVCWRYAWLGYTLPPRNMLPASTPLPCITHSYRHIAS